MSTPSAATTPVFDPSVPMTAKFRSDIAWRLAQGWSLEQLAQTLNCNQDDLRLAIESDPLFGEVQQAAWARVAFDADADGMRRLRLVANTGSGESATQAAEVLIRYADLRREKETRRAIEQERNKTRLEIERLRAEARIEVEKLRSARAAKMAEAKSQEQEEPQSAGVGIPPDPTPEELERRYTEEAAQEEAEVYLWGGRHEICEGRQPDAADIRVRIEKDFSLAIAGGRQHVYWVIAHGDRDNPLGPKTVLTPGMSA